MFRNSGAIMDNGEVKFVDLKTLEWREYVAKDFYEQMRNMERDEVIKKISKNTKVKEEIVNTAVKHVLDSKYLLDDYETLEKELKNFDPDYDMAHSFSRMITGKDIQNHDTILLKHESLEAYYMDEQSMDYIEAHKLTNKKYDYIQALVEDENRKE